MKKILFLLLVLSVVGVYSCADLDDIQPTDSVPPEQAITNFNSASAALAGVYDEMQQDSYDKWLSLWQYFSDETVFTGTFPTRLEFGNFNVFTSNTTMAAVFSSYYDAINVANNVIALTPQVDDPSLTPEATNTIVAEARYLRGLCYLYLTQGWNDVPLVLEPTTTADEKLNVPTASRAEVLAQVRADFEFAAANLGPVGDPGRANADAANGMLARLALIEGNYEEAYSKAVGVLGEDFDLTAFGYLEDQLSILKFSSTDGNALNFFYGPAEFGGRHSIEPSPTLIDAYEEGDIRRDASIVVDTAVATVPFGIKYDDFAGGSTAGSDPVIWLRHAELVLIAAEAAAEQGNFDDANMWYNQVRSRAGLDDKELDGDNYVDLILQERFVELAMEGPFRLWDLRRRGLALEKLSPLGYDACDDVWPLPQRDIDRNPNLVQNDCCNC